MSEMSLFLKEYRPSPKIINPASYSVILSIMEKDIFIKIDMSKYSRNYTAML